MSESMQDQESIAVNMSVSGENEQLSQQLDPQEVGSFARSSSRTQGAAGKLLARTRTKVRNDDSEEQLRTLCEKAGFIRAVSEGMYYRTGEDEFGNLVASCREYTLSRTHPHSEAKLWIYKYREIGPVLDVKLICHHNVHGVEIQILSTYGDDTKVWVVISRSSNRYVDELRHRESGNLPEEVAQECVQDQDTEHSKVRRPHSCS